MSELAYVLPEDRSVVRQIILLIPDYFDSIDVKLFATREMYARGVVAPNTRLEMERSFIDAHTKRADDIPFEEIRKDQEPARDEFGIRPDIEGIALGKKKYSTIF